MVYSSIHPIMGRLVIYVAGAFALTNVTCTGAWSTQGTQHLHHVVTEGVSQACVRAYSIKMAMACCIPRNVLMQNHEGERCGRGASPVSSSHSPGSHGHGPWPHTNSSIASKKRATPIGASVPNLLAQVSSNGSKLVFSPQMVLCCIGKTPRFKGTGFPVQPSRCPSPLPSNV